MHAFHTKSSCLHSEVDKALGAGHTFQETLAAAAVDAASSQSGAHRYEFMSNESRCGGVHLEVFR